MNTFTQRLFRSAHRSLDDLESWLSRPERPNLPTWAVQVPRCAALPAPQAQKPAARPPVRSTAYAWRQRAAQYQRMTDREMRAELTRLSVPGRGRKGLRKADRLALLLALCKAR